MKHLLSCWNVVAGKIREAKHILLLTDYDGTLTPIVGRPELANLPQRAKQSLQLLAENPHLTLGIISGRTLEDLQEKVGIEGIIYVGNHGLEIEGPGITYVNPVAGKAGPILSSLSEELSKALSGIKGAWMDNKGLTLSLHYRFVDEAQIEEMSEIFHEAIKASLASGEVQIIMSKKAYDIKPTVDWDKGEAAAFIAKRISKKEPLTVYLGDDVTDYDGFRTVDENGGISIYVGEENTEPVAQYFLYAPEEVYQFLDMLRETLSSQ